MYHKAIKKAICFIMTVTFIFCCYSPASAAVSIVDTSVVISIPDYGLSADDLVNTDPMDSDGYYLAHYRFCVTPRIYFRSQGYLNGHFKFNVSTSVDTQNQD